jgi:hypothetical protein
MKMYRFKYVFLLILLYGCSQSSKIENAINDVYGKKITSKKNEEGGLVYVLDYSQKRDEQDKDVTKLKDKIDKAVDATVSKKDSDLESYSPDAVSSATASCDCLSDVYHWDTPTIRVLLITRRCIPDKGNDITVVINEK